MANFRYELLKGTPFIKAFVMGKSFQFTGRFIIDTGAAMTIIQTSNIDALGYSARDAFAHFSTESVIGKEAGYLLRVKTFEIFGMKFENLEVGALDLPKRYNIDGLIGMNVLGKFNWCLHPKELLINVTINTKGKYYGS